MLVKLRMEHHDVLFLLGSEALVELVAIAVVEDIIALNAVLFGKIVLELIVGIVEHTVAVEVEPYRPAVLERQSKKTVIYYTRVFKSKVENIVKSHEQFIKCIVESRRRRNSSLRSRFADTPISSPIISAPMFR